MKKLGEVEYAGFSYDIYKDCKDRLSAIPVAGQHSACNKEKHRRAALEEFNNG